MSTADIQSVIQCGVSLDDCTYTFKLYSDYFDKEVELFYALNDPSKTVLYRTLEIASRIDMPTNRLSIFIKRHQRKLGLLFKSTGFVFKPPHTQGLKVGSYFISIEAVRRIEEYFTKSKPSFKKQVSNSNESKSESSSISSADRLPSSSISSTCESSLNTSEGEQLISKHYDQPQVTFCNSMPDQQTGVLYVETQGYAQPQHSYAQPQSSSWDYSQPQAYSVPLQVQYYQSPPMQNDGYAMNYCGYYEPAPQYCYPQSQYDPQTVKQQFQTNAGYYAVPYGY